MFESTDDSNQLHRKQPINKDQKSIESKMLLYTNQQLSEFSNPTIKRVVIQIGMDKTASTSIQFFLARNREWLNQNSVEYRTDFGAKNHSVPLKSILSDTPENIYWHIVSNHSAKQINEYNRKNSLSLCTGIRDCRQETYVFFGEGICGFKTQELKNLKRLIKILMPQASTEILFCVRSVSNYSSSGYQQAVRMGRTYGEISLITKYSNIYFRRLLRPLLIFGKKNITVYKFEDTITHEFGPAGFFVELLGLSPRDMNELIVPKANASLSFQAIEILEYINDKKPLILNNKKNPNRFKGDIDMISQIRGSKFQLPSDIIKKINRYSLFDILWLRLTFKIIYSFQETKDILMKIEYPDDYRNDFVDSYKKSNHTIRWYLFEFLMGKIDSSCNSENRMLFTQIKEDIESLERTDYEKSLL
jgi:hypothetical protein